MLLSPATRPHPNPSIYIKIYHVASRECPTPPHPTPKDDIRGEKCASVLIGIPSQETRLQDDRATNNGNWGTPIIKQTQVLVIWDHCPKHCAAMSMIHIRARWDCLSTRIEPRF